MSSMFEKVKQNIGELEEVDQAVIREYILDLHFPDLSGENVNEFISFTEDTDIKDDIEEIFIGKINRFPGNLMENYIFANGPLEEKNNRENILQDLGLVD